MTTPPATYSRQSAADLISNPQEATGSGVSWPAVFAGAAVTAALSLVLLSLGAGLGLSSISPWSRAGADAGTLGAAAIVWLIFNEIVSSAMGGYLAGRLRTKWSSVHNDEVYFRDTAHGFLVWAVAVIITAASLATAATSMVGGNAGSPAGGGSAATAEYFVDTLLRGGSAQAGATDTFLYGEVDRIFARDLQEKELPDTDRNYVAQQVATKTGINQSDAQARVNDTFNQAKLAIDTARKAAAHMLLWLFLALLIGAFSASYAATIGGRQRDHLQVI